MIRSPSFPYVAPFVAFLGFLALYRNLALSPLVGQAAFVVAMALVIWFFARHASDLKDGIHVRFWAASVAIGAATFLIWIIPDRWFPGYRHHWLFENPVLGKALSGDVQGTAGPVILLLRTARAVLIVPLVEELFWRAWMMRWVIRPDFLSLPLGAWSVRAFLVVAVLFATEHGSYWDVGLCAGVIYNWWMVKSKSLGDLVLTHAVTNLCLSVYVVVTGAWEFWQ